MPERESAYALGERESRRESMPEREHAGERVGERERESLY
jgi:hypothetical protein